MGVTVLGIISIHALLAESDSTLHNILKLFPISIHALLAESDQEKNNGHETAPDISIHALLAESDVLSRAFVLQT